MEDEEEEDEMVLRWIQFAISNNQSNNDKNYVVIKENNRYTVKCVEKSVHEMKQKRLDKDKSHKTLQSEGIKFGDIYVIKT